MVFPVPPHCRSPPLKRPLRRHPPLRVIPNRSLRQFQNRPSQRRPPIRRRAKSKVRQGTSPVPGNRPHHRNTHIVGQVQRHNIASQSRQRPQRRQHRPIPHILTLRNRRTPH